MSDPYLVLSSPGVVELWSSLRLPYEPRGSMLEMRQCLRSSLDDLATKSSSGRLHAIYCAADDGAFVDIENVLLYNVGGRALRPLTKYALTIERGFNIPTPPRGAGFSASQHLHYHRYSEAIEGSQSYWELGNPLGSFTDIPLDAIDKPAQIWKSIRDHAVPPPETASAPTRFHINVDVTDTVPAGRSGSAFGLVKPLLDGIISGYHSHNSSDGVAEADRLAATGLGASDELRKQLLNPEWAALGERRLLSPFGVTGVQWNPADDFCVSAQITLRTQPASVIERSARWRLSSELREAKLKT